MEIKIEHILKLARLEVSKEEKKKLEKDFSAILDFVQTLEEIKIDSKEFENQKQELQNVLREDTQKISNSQFLISKKLIDSAPETKDGYIKTKQIL